MVKAAKMIRAHLDGIITAIVQRATNAGAESINAKIQRVKRMACGYRNRERFRNPISFHLGGLDLYPNPSTTRIREVPSFISFAWCRIDAGSVRGSAGR